MQGFPLYWSLLRHCMFMQFVHSIKWIIYVKNIIYKKSFFSSRISLSSSKNDCLFCDRNLLNNLCTLTSSMLERVKRNKNLKNPPKNNQSQNIRLALVFVWNEHYGKGFIAIFRGFFASINKSFVLAGRMGTRLLFFEV